MGSCAMEVLSISLFLFSILDPLGNLPMFISGLKHVDRKRRPLIVIREMLFVLFIMVVMLFFGEKGLAQLSLRIETISITGGVILFIIAQRMIFPKQASHREEESLPEPFLVPLAIPLVAGPAALIAVVQLAHRHSGQLLIPLMAIILAWSASLIIFLFSKKCADYLGPNGVRAVENLMGIVLLMIAVQMFLDGLCGYLGGILKIELQR